MAKITVDEWQAELQRIGEIGQGDEGQTTVELADQFGISPRRMANILRKGVAEGRYIKGVSMREDVTGRQQKAPVYRIKKDD